MKRAIAAVVMVVALLVGATADARAQTVPPLTLPSGFLVFTGGAYTPLGLVCVRTVDLSIRELSFAPGSGTGFGLSLVVLDQPPFEFGDFPPSPCFDSPR